jgi:hypothetical protein
VSTRVKTTIQAKNTYKKWRGFGSGMCSAALKRNRILKEKLVPDGQGPLVLVDGKDILLFLFFI